jgi:hypothetical protein
MLKEEIKINRTAIFVCLKYTGSVHEVVNTATIIILLKLYEKVIVYASQDMCMNTQKQLTSLGISQNNIDFKHKYYTHFKRGMIKTIVDAMRLIIIAFQNILHKSDFYYGTVNYVYLPFSNNITKFFNQRHFHICHDELRHLFTNRSNAGGREWAARIYAMNKINFSENCKFIVLGDSIKRNLMGKISNSAFHNICSIIHPYYDISMGCVTKSQHSHIKIGVVSEVRNEELFNNIISFNKILENYNNIFLHLVSKNSNFDFSNMSHIINENKTNKLLSRSDYDQIVRDLDYIYFPYSIDSYKYGASGAVYEAIVKGKPFIAYANDYFKMIIKKFGPVGYLFETEEEMKEVVSKIANSEIKYDKSTSTKAKQYIDPRNYFNEFRLQLSL